MRSRRRVDRKPDLSVGQGRRGAYPLATGRLPAFRADGEPAVYLPLAELLDRGIEILDNLEQYELVCLDDLQAVAGRADWEEALFHLFNRLRDSGRRLLIAASTSPRELPVKLADLKSRLTLALIFQMRPLSDEDKLRALQLRASRRGLHLTDEVGHFILTRGTRSMSALFELLERLDQAFFAGSAQADHSLPQGNPRLVASPLKMWGSANFRRQKTCVFAGLATQKGLNGV